MQRNGSCKSFFEQKSSYFRQQYVQKQPLPAVQQTVVNNHSSVVNFCSHSNISHRTLHTFNPLVYDFCIIHDYGYLHSIAYQFVPCLYCVQVCSTKKATLAPRCSRAQCEQRVFVQRNTAHSALVVFVVDCHRLDNNRLSMRSFFPAGTRSMINTLCVEFCVCMVQVPGGRIVVNGVRSKSTGTKYSLPIKVQQYQSLTSC
jgi:hypothetical protein